MRPETGVPRSLLAILGVLAVATLALAQSFPWPPKPRAEQPAAVPAQAAPERSPSTPQPPVGGVPLPSPSFEPGPVATVTTAAPPARAPIDWRILENPNGPHTALFFDPVRQVFAVYHIDSGSGQIMLKSIRSLSADLRLEQFNSSNPAPKDIQAMLEEAR
ncbi:hypothetical protein MalM25_26200 [Planctomycetes bacterium MalM25]|nr:hypothetical protein MalM25_26200 [Planctomycetes bacterium MalM25]